MPDLPFFMPKGSGGEHTVEYKTWDPSIDQDGIVDWTLVDGTTEKPNPVDMNPYDEWSDITEDDDVSEYEWEDM